MDFTEFVKREAIPALTWLGRRDWLDYGRSDSFEKRTVWTRPKELEVSPEDKAKYPKEHWDQVNHILKGASSDVVNSFLALALSKAIAGGPKVFRPTVEDCEALENTACTVSFEDYKQPYPVIIIEFPKEYRQRLAKMWDTKKGPSYVIVHHDANKGFITVSAWFDKDNVFSHITPARPEYKTIEDAIVINKKRQPSLGDEEVVEIAELSQRLAVNFCMVMVLLGVRQAGPLNPEDFAKAKKLARNSNQKKATLGQKLMASTMYKLEFIQQKIKLFEEEFIEPRKPGSHDVDVDSHRTSPKPHWRKGHYRQQPTGPKNSLRKLVFIKPILVRAAFFGGDIKDTQVTYTITTHQKR